MDEPNVARLCYNYSSFDCRRIALSSYQQPRTWLLIENAQKSCPTAFNRNTRVPYLDSGGRAAVDPARLWRREKSVRNRYATVKSTNGQGQENANKRNYPIPTCSHRSFIYLDSERRRAIGAARLRRCEISLLRCVADALHTQKVNGDETAALHSLGGASRAVDVALQRKTRTTVRYKRTRTKATVRSFSVEQLAVTDALHT